MARPGEHPELPFIAYKGDGPYVFVSYAHEDAELVYDELRWLKDQGINVWYDEGISPGHVWPKELATTIEGCDLMLLFVTEAAIASKGCLREVHFAIEHGKPFLAVHLDDSPLPSDWEFAIGDRQAVIKARMSPEMYQAKLLGALGDYLPAPDETVSTVTSSDQGETELIGSSNQEKSSSRVRWLATGTLLAAAAIAATFWVRLSAEQDWVESEALPAIRQHISKDAYGPAYLAALEVQRRAGEDAVPAEIWEQASVTVSVDSKPQGASVSYRLYDHPDGDWIPIGETPLQDIQLPRDLLVLRYEKPGYTNTFRVAHNPGIFTRNAAYDEAFTDGLFAFGAERPIVELAPEGSVPDGMVMIPETRFPLQFTGFPLEIPIHIPAFLIDSFETTNAEFQEFLDAGGYQNPVLWQEVDYIDGDRRLDWQQATTRFVDTTGRPGPAGWELGRYPAGKDDYPVHGISWFEALAYAKFRGKTLPTAHQWIRSSVMLSECCEPIAPKLTSLSNFSGTLQPQGSTLAMGPFGTYDIAGSVREWTLNASGSRRVTLGGATTDPPYLFYTMNPEDPWSRSGLTGVRLIQPLEAVPEELMASIPPPEPPEPAAPLSADAFETTATSLQYVPFDADPRIERVEDTPYGLMRIVSLGSGMSDERFDAYVFIPDGFEPPYQTLLFMGGYGGFAGPGLFEKQLQWSLDEVFSIFLRTGRAVVWPVWYGSFERYDDIAALHDEELMTAWMERFRSWHREADKVIEYLDSTGDFTQGIAWLGLSYGAAAEYPLYTLVPRIKTSILISGGYPDIESSFNKSFIEAVDKPVLMLNGRYDYIVPLARAERKFQSIATDPADKKLVLYDSGHWPLPRNQIAREMVDWLDERLGPVVKNTNR